MQIYCVSYVINKVFYVCRYCIIIEAGKATQEWTSYIHLSMATGQNQTPKSVNLLEMESTIDLQVLVFCYERYEVLIVASVKILALWTMLGCSLVDWHQQFRGSCCFHLVGR